MVSFILKVFLFCGFVLCSVVFVVVVKVFGLVCWLISVCLVFGECYGCVFMLFSVMCVWVMWLFLVLSIMVVEVSVNL